MESFKNLVEVANRLNAPDGCPWDIKQTLHSISKHLLEEVHEVLEAVDEDDSQKMIEEVGDLFYLCIFLCKIGEREGKFSLDSMIKNVSEKLIRRHPHVFGDKEVKDSDEVIRIWEEAKAEEKAKKRTPFDDIPKTMSLMSKSQKVIKRLSGEPLPEIPKNELGEKLLSLLIEAHQTGRDAERELLKAVRTHLKAPKDFC
ncbi:MAG: hypothetical protein SP1CHLAM54_09340 [Chlamydiia bacterium]|nr:hypothetical protein [Chlamydiia bacterium]MCH9615840.1 hypothetical protein [Chlamydiia bacterium]MCH9628757.1 hypothetical protein [Chlamydiia bacterium]